MKTLTLFIALLVLAVALAGCTSQQLPPPSSTPVQSATSATPPVSATSQTPAPEAVVAVPDDIVAENPDTGALNDVAIDTRTLG
ncbi:MAG: hypothetical protein V1702_03945 [Candidatus Woesearchaeota archaeon]